MRADAHGAETNLHVRENFALQPVHRDHGDRESEKDEQNVDGDPENVSGSAWGLVAGEIVRDVLDQVVHFLLVACPQRLKPQIFAASYGTAEAVPFPFVPGLKPFSAAIQRGAKAPLFHLTPG
jgi:hypothetical protein